MRDPRVFTIPPCRAFLPTLADALLSGDLTDGWPDGATLPDATVYLPTARACRAFAAELAGRGEARAAALPRIVPLGDAEAGPAPDDLDRPPAVPPLERRLTLARLVQAWAGAAERRAEFRLPPGAPFLSSGSPADAVGLAADLEALMDALGGADLRWDDLAAAVDSEHSAYFASTLEFVRIVRESWPDHLNERRASDPARSRDEALAAEGARLAASPPAGPVVAAGATGSAPATARLLAAIARAPHGAVVLPGLDLDLDEAGWAAIGGAADGGGRPEPLYGHPQFMLRRLLTGALGATRADVRVLGAPPPARAAARARLLSEAMRPAETTDRWAALRPAERAALAAEGGAELAVVDADDEREEALAAAIALREALAETDGAAALVTADRGLARRVAAELRRWGVQAEDGAGIALAEAPAGRLARLAAEAAPDFEPASVLALLSHPLLSLGLPRAALERGRAALEIAVLRGPAPRPGLDGLRAAFDLRRRERGWRDPLPRRRLPDEGWAEAAGLLGRLRSAFAPLLEGPAEPVGMLETAGRHAAVMAALLEPGPDEPEAAGEDVDALHDLFDDLERAARIDGGAAEIAGRLRDYPGFFATVARERVVSRAGRGSHGRVAILGPAEARLLHFDRVVLGGLDEGVWPPAAETDAFLNRPMRLALGLTPAERRIGQSAHDLAQLLGCGRAVLTRARKRGGKPTTPSRFLERLRAFSGAAGWAALTGRGDRYRALAAALDRAPPVPIPPRPAPRPGGARFPRSLSVTEIETLVRDPYAIFARHVLRLQALDPLAAVPGVGERGSLIHDVLATFSADHPGDLPANAEDILAQLGLDAFSGLADAYPELHALWWPEFQRVAPEYLAWERARRAGLKAVHVERSGKVAIPLPDGRDLTLRGRADRIEIALDGSAVIVDYKTGSPPNDKVIGIGFSPQMTLQAAMLLRGGFDGVSAAADTPTLEYVKLGGRVLLARRVVKPTRGDPRTVAAIVDEHFRRLGEMARRYVAEDEAYVSRPYVQHALRFSTYDHLARVKEWSLATAAEAGA